MRERTGKFVSLNAQGGASALHQSQRSVLTPTSSETPSMPSVPTRPTSSRGRQINGGDRNESASWKIDMANSFSLLTQRFSERQLDGLAMCQQPTALQGRQGGQKEICPCSCAWMRDGRRGLISECRE